ncbi:hypothetical protein BKA69DRAFT_1090559, partial [Paraphysoderma sedebokerense]
KKEKAEHELNEVIRSRLEITSDLKIVFSNVPSEVEIVTLLKSDEGLIVRSNPYCPAVLPPRPSLEEITAHSPSKAAATITKTLKSWWKSNNSLNTDTEPHVITDCTQLEGIFGSGTVGSTLPPIDADEEDEANSRIKKMDAEIKELTNAFGDTALKLNERGERLQILQEKTAEMENESSNFAALAKELRKREENKKWYQM